MNRPVTSASNLRRRELCPGSERMEYGLPEEDSEESREGMLLHDYDARPEYDRSVLRPDLRDLLERNDALKRTIGERLAGVVGIHPVALSRETRLDNGLISGKPDLVSVYPTEAFDCWINDSKFGFKIVERAELNLQLRAYAVLVFDFHEKKPKRLFVSITQPRLSYDERITMAEYVPDDIEASREQIQDILKASADPKAKLSASEEACRYCKAKLICPEFQKTMAVPVLALQSNQNLSVTAREAYLEERLSKVSDGELERVLIAVSFAAMIKNPASDEARKRIADGRFENYYLAKPKVERGITDPQKAISLLELGKVATREFMLSVCSIPLGKLEEAYREKHKCTWKEAREKIDKVLQSVIETTEQKPRILKK